MVRIHKIICSHYIFIGLFSSKSITDLIYATGEHSSTTPR